MITVSQHQFDTIGIIHSPYKEKFAVPRQPGLVTAAKAQLELLPPYNQIDSIRGIEDFSHLWLTFVFHQTADKGWKPLVRPPRLGGNKKVGVFATRSTFRPNPIGLSVVTFEGIEQKNKKLFLNISGIDLVDGTPILDIKPYIPYADALPDAKGGFAQDKPEKNIAIEFSPQALEAIHRNETRYPELKLLIEQVLAQDPRPAYKGKNDTATYGMTLHDLNITWSVSEENNQALTQVISVEAI